MGSGTCARPYRFHGCCSGCILEQVRHSDETTTLKTTEMKGSYQFQEIERRWRQRWLREKTFKTHGPGENGTEDSRPKCYVLDMFPYPSGDGLHIGHPKGYIASDIYSRFKRMCGFNVLHPMGFDSFGLPAEQYAIANNVHPSTAYRRMYRSHARTASVLGPVL